jgi:hypothetical protein
MSKGKNMIATNLGVESYRKSASVLLVCIEYS